MTAPTWVIPFAVLLVSSGLPIVLHPLLRQLGVIDVPNDRSSHTDLAIRGVGIAPMAGLAFGGLLLAGPAASGGGWAVLLACIATALMAAGIGLIEDVRGIRTPIRVVLQLGVGLVGATAILAVTGVAFVWIPLGALAIATYINASNFMDGIDAISGMHGTVVGGVYATIGVMIGNEWLVMGGAVLAVAFLGFLPWNVLRGHMFLGDVGSYLLGAMIAALAFAAFLIGVNPIALVAPVSLYLTDTGITIFRRMRRGEPWLEAHRSHIYQRLTDRGLSHLQVASIVAGGSLAAGAAGLLSVNGSPAMMAVSIASIAFILLAYVRSAPTGQRLAA